MLTEILPKNSYYSLEKKELHIEGYENFISSLEKGRGVAIYVHQSFSATSVEILNKFPFEESVWCEIKISNCDKILVGCIYRSPRKSSHENNSALNRLLKTATNLNYTYFLIAGDFNYKDINWSDLQCDLPIESDTSIFLEVIKDTFFNTTYIAAY